MSARPKTAINQAKFGLSRIAQALEALEGENAEVLEVGAGSFLLSAYIASKGFKVTALEPLSKDFSWFAALQSEVLGFCLRHNIVFDRTTSFAEHFVASGKFDLIFSVHVLEHMRDPLRALDNMYESLRPRGQIVTICPNYDVPFEPHLGIFLIGRSKAFNARLYPTAVSRKQDVWDALTFVRCSQLKRHLSRKRASFFFGRTMLRDAFLRLGEDEMFRQRMPKPVHWAYRLLRGVRLIGLLPLIPARLQTPMELVIKR
ncbi:MAG: class I SAM-dependent methyltransferase [Hyphomicrobiales bacterium]|nr:class I SAM-dependent methyltransferase [Hyphomicrobiales bacterium]